jgi:Flp pilus assembly protein TadD
MDQETAHVETDHGPHPGGRPRQVLPAIGLALVLVVAAVVVGSRLAGPPPRVAYLALLEQGDAHARAARRTAAVAAYRDAVALLPDDPAAHVRLARVSLEWGRADETLAALAEAERLGADEATVEELRVATHVAGADWPAVVSHSQRLLALAPPEAAEARETRHTLARAYEALEEWEAARAEYEALAQADPTDGLARERLGLLLLGDDPEAVRHLFAAGTGLAQQLLAVLQEPGTAENPAYVSGLQGQVLLGAREWALAARQFERALSINPNYAEARAYLGYALDQVGRSAEARTHLVLAAGLAPDSAVTHVLLGLHYDRQGDLPAARAEYEAAYDLDPQNPATCVEIGQTWAAEREYTAAEVWLQEAVSLQPDDPTWWEILVRFYLAHNITEGRSTEAAAELVRLVPEDAEAHDLHGWAALQAGEYEAAQESLMEALALDPALAPAHYHLGLLRVAQGERGQAEASFVRALDFDTTGEMTLLVERALDDLR